MAQFPIHYALRIVLESLLMQLWKHCFLLTRSILSALSGFYFYLFFSFFHLWWHAWLRKSILLARFWNNSLWSVPTLSCPRREWCYFIVTLNHIYAKIKCNNKTLLMAVHQNPGHCKKKKKKRKCIPCLATIPFKKFLTWSDYKKFRKLFMIMVLHLMRKITFQKNATKTSSAPFPA